ncbi:cytochrome P450 [Streptomyces sp. NPDC101227]|uniref:cytochrome P450 n=1 Tax=Streptomyces sp. NPDC101227 TaxID=3366136 RepID=UPI00382DC0F7
MGLPPAGPPPGGPGRWTDRPHASTSRHGFAAFGGGARKCLGDEFAMIEGTLALAAITTPWRLHPQPGTGHHPRVRSTLQPRALRIRVTAWDDDAVIHDEHSPTCSPTLRQN